MIMLRTFFLKVFFGVFFALILMEMQVSTTLAQFDSQLSYQVIAEALAVKNNFAQARKKAVKKALKLALEQDLRAFLGDEEFERNQQEMQGILRKPEKYVKSYRFLEAYDDPIKLVSQVKLEVVLFQNAVNNFLNRTGVTMGLEGGKQVVILINESNLSSDNELLFWETMPISETSLIRYFIEEGIPVVRRGLVRYAIPEETVMNAMKGDLSAAFDIGLKAGADIVIVGNATSSLMTDDKNQSQQSVRVSVSVKAVSSHESMRIAAKSDFATASGNEVLASELEAFHIAGKKLTEFLVPAIQKHWEARNEKKKVKQSVPTPKTNTQPLPWGDL